MYLLPSLKAKIQVGVIRFGNGLNIQQAIKDAKAAGYIVLLCGEYAELYR